MCGNDSFLVLHLLSPFPMYEKRRQTRRESPLQLGISSEERKRKGCPHNFHVFHKNVSTKREEKGKENSEERGKETQEAAPPLAS